MPRTVLHFSPAFSGPAFSYPGNLVPHFPVVSVGLWSIWSFIHPSFSGPAFSVDAEGGVLRVPYGGCAYATMVPDMSASLRATT